MYKVETGRHKSATDTGFIHKKTNSIKNIFMVVSN